MTDTPLTRDPVAYTVLEKSLIGNRMYEAGETVQYDGLPAENLAPTCNVGRARYQEYLETNAARVAKMRADNAESSVGDPASFGKELAKALAAGKAEDNARFDALADAIKAMADNQAALLAALTAWQGDTKGKAKA